MTTIVSVDFYSVIDDHTIKIFCEIKQTVRKDAVIVG